MTSGEPTGAGKGWLLMAVGLLAVALGALWCLQGLDVLRDSVMSGEQMWSIIGPLVALAGLGLIVAGVRRRSRSKRV